MTLAEYASGGIVTAFVFYLLALLAHSAEWASLRGIPLRDPSAGVPTTAATSTAATSTAATSTAVHDAAAPDAAAEASDAKFDPARLRADMFGRLGIILTVLGAASQLAGVVARGVAAGRAPWGNMYEFVTAALLFAAIAYLFGVWRWGLRWLGLPMTLLLSVGNGLAVTVFYVAIAPLVPALHSVWFIIHIVAACISAAAFNLGALASIVYLIKRRAVLRAEKRHPENPTLTGIMARVPSLAAIDRFAYRAHAFGFPVWTFTIAAGSIWAEYAWGRFWGWDPKETWSLVTWVVYAAYLHARATAGWKGRNAAIIAVVGIASFWFNFVGVNLLVSGLHSYAGI